MGKRTYNIRWRESDEKELQRAINNYNAKLYRFSKKHDIPLDVMPKRVNKTGLKEDITTRTDLNNIIKSLQTIDNAMIHTTRGGKLSIGDYKVWKDKEKRANQIKKKERERIENLPTFTAGKPTNLKKGQMHSVKDNSLKERNRNIKNMSNKDIDASFKALDSVLNKRYANERKKSYRENYITALKNNGVYSEEIEKLVKSVPLQWFVDTAELDEQANIEFAYTEEQAERIKGLIKNAWKESVKRYRESKRK